MGGIYEGGYNDEVEVYHPIQDDNQKSSQRGRIVQPKEKDIFNTSQKSATMQFAFQYANWTPDWSC